MLPLDEASLERVKECCRLPTHLVLRDGLRHASETKMKPL